MADDETISLWRLTAPWLTYLLLGAAALLGLSAASGAADDGTYVAGLFTTLLALILLCWHVKNHVDGKATRLLPPFAVSGIDALILCVAILTIFAIVGLLLAAHAGGALADAGIAAFFVCGGLIFLEMKHHFDQLDRH